MLERAASFRHALRPFRRRLQIVQVVESLPVACSLGVALAATIVLVAHPGWETSWGLLTAGILTSALVVAAKAVVCPPSLETTATKVDREYALESYAVTALQFEGTRDRVSQRIVADARTRLGGLDCHQLTWSLPRRAWWSASAAALIVATVLVAANGSAPVWRAVSLLRGEADGATAGRTASDRPSTRARSTAAVAQASAGLLQTDRANRRAPSSASGEHGGTLQPVRRSAALDEGANPSDAAAQPSQGEAGRPQAGSVALSGTRPIGSPDAIAHQTSNGSAREGAAAGGGSVTGKSARSGGVNGDSALAKTGAQASRASGGQVTAAQYRQAVAHAEAAIAQRRVPARLRAYVRDYFVSLREAAGQ
jgi:hypothetical protein